MAPNEIINKFPNAKILIIGDVMLDKYSFGKVERISPEAPIPIVHVQSEKYVPGGAANVANNISALDGKAFIVGVIGNDYAGKILLNELKKRKINTSGIITTKNKNVPTIQKNRILGQNQQLIRIDHENIEYEENKKIISNIEKLIKTCDVAIVSDYAKGVVTKEIMEKIKLICKTNNKKIIVDPKPKHKEWYKNIFLITPNTKEAYELAKEDHDTNFDIIGKKLVSELNVNILMTRGEKGMSLFENFNNHKTIHLPTKAQEVFDVSGAGDTVVAAAAICIACGASLRESADIANHAAGIVVGKLGTATLTRKELLISMKRD